MKKQSIAVLICFIGSIAVVAWSHFATAGNPPSAGPFAVEVDTVPATAAMGVGLNYTTSFEPEEGFPLGYISNTPGTHPAGCGGPAFPCWGHTTSANASLITPTIEAIHPHSGLQHLQLIHDPTTRTNQPNFGLGVDARFPRAADLSARPIAPNSVSVDMAISAPGGQDFRVQLQSPSQTFIATSALFFYTGEIYVLDDFCGAVGLGFQPTGFQWDTTGGYQNYTVVMNPCTNTIVYSYAGESLYAGCVYAGLNLEQFLVFGDNFPGSSMDVDNVVLWSEAGCPCVCGNGVVEYVCEQCEPSNDTNCPGRCIAPGGPGECTCTPICTEANPCPLENGANGPYVTSDGFYVYTGGAPFVSIDTCGSNFDSFMDITGGATGYNDNCNGGQFGADADPSASCYETTVNANAYPSCTCVANSGGTINIEVGSFGMLPGQSPPPVTRINIRKKSVCAGPSVGACCDTNGADQGCTDNVLSGACSGADKVFTDQGKCEDVVCECILDCTGRVCGDDGCGGSCGTCGDSNVCNGVETCNASGQCDPGTPLVCNDGNACNGVESCNAATGCVPVTALSCDDGLYCDGLETCAPATGCVSGTPPCADDETCDEATDTCVPNAIPTVSQWGLVVLTIVLLVAAKVQFGRRRLA